jgi:para-nitrobenzyl esterase
VLRVYAAAYPAASPAERYVLMTTHRAYGFDTVTLADRKATQGGAPVYVYQFDWQPPAGAPGIMAHHGLELTFVFDNVTHVPAPSGGGPDAQALAARVSTAWTAFARTGAPAAAELPPWPPYTADARETMHLDTTCALARDPIGAERRLWATL